MNTRVSKVRSHIAAAIIHYVSSSWVEAYAGATSSTHQDGVLQASAQLGSAVEWGYRSTSSSKAQVLGFNFTHKARILRNNVVIVSS